MIAPPAAPPPVVAPLAPADRASVSAALTDAQVSVTTGFRGARIVLYGAIFDPEARPSDVVVVVRGPEAPIRIVRRIRVAGLWLNSRPVLFEGAPGFYMAASTRPLADISGFGTLRRLGLGLSHLTFNAPAEQRVETRYGVPDVVVNRLGPDYPLYRQAVVRLQTRRDLYSADSTAVRFVDRGLFRAEIDLPSEAPTGEYQAVIHLFQDGRAVSSRRLSLTVEKTGFERLVYVLSQRRPWTYGALSVFIALASGWLAATLFRRN